MKQPTRGFFSLDFSMLHLLDDKFYPKLLVINNATIENYIIIQNAIKIVPT